MTSGTKQTMRYYDLKKNWRRVKPHLADKKLNDILVRDFNKFTFGRWGQTFTYGNLSREFESCDWDIGHRGKHPAFWQYTKHAACYWLVNFNLHLATLVEPAKPWRIITSEKHSTVWDGSDTLFDFNFQAFGIDPNECFETAFEKELKPGKYLRVHLAENFQNETSQTARRMKRTRTFRSVSAEIDASKGNLRPRPSAICTFNIPFKVADPHVDFTGGLT